MDWSLCIICQKVEEETLSCPLNRQNHDAQSVYQTFLKNVEEFKKIGALPVAVDYGSEGTPENFVSNKASWHRSCHQKFNKSKLERQITKKRKNEKSSEEPEVRRSKRDLSFDIKTVCIFCEDATSHKLHAFTTFSAEQSLREMATMMQDTKLLAKMSGGDLVALEAKYHLTCLTKYRNSYRSYNRRSTQTTSEQDRVNARAFVELVSHIENAVEDGQHIFKLSDLHLLYQQRLGELGHNITVNRTRLKVKLLDYFGDLGIQEQTDGKNVALIFPSGMEEMLKTALVEQNYESEALLFAKVAKICRNEMFREGETVTFDGHFPKQCQDILPSTRLLVSMILYGTSLKSDIHDTQSSKTISQLLLHNSRKRKRTESSYSRHSLDHEAALPTYIGLNVHTLTRSKTMVDQLARLGISISYSRVLQLEDQLAASMCQQFHAEGIVCPSNLRKGLFCVGALDNIDYNPSSTTSQGSFHGSGISVIQFPSKSNPGTLRPSNPAPPVSRTDRASLPESFTIVDAVQLKPSSTNIPESNIVHVPVEGKLTKAKKSEEEWIEHATSFLGKSEVGKEDAVTWAAYHASKQLPDTENQPARTALLPLFHEKADSPAMIKHAMNILKSITQYLNPGQIPVLACDCPIFANSKYIQWKWPANYGEDKIIIMFGGLHLEKAMWTALGDLLSHSGWTNALTDSGISSAGTSDSFLKSSHITRSRHAHQLTALALSKLQIEAYNQNQKQDGESFHTWREDMIRKSPTFQFWDLVLQTEIEILIFIRAHRTKDFDLYVESLKDLMFLFFALDHYNYSRWVSVHVRDMESLSPEFRDDFQKYWVVNKTCHRFSAIPIDQVHEQENAKVKGKGGVIGLTENPDAFQRWMIAGPEQARLLAEFEEDYLPDEDPEINYKHHEEGFAVQKAFVKQTDSLIQVIREYGNPFQDDCPELLVLNTRDCADESVIHTVRHIREIGCEQYSTFQQEVFVNREKAIHDSIKKNSLPLFKTVTKPRGKDKKKMTALRNDVNLFGRLYIANQQRYGDLSVFFSHENQLFPPSLSDDGKLRTPTSKSELLKCLDTDEQPECPQRFDCKIFDGAALVHSLPLSSATTFADYGDMVFKPYIKQELQKVNRVDLVWDRYYQSSLKKTTREKRGIGIRRKVTPTTKVPTKWKDFLSDSHNKEELFAYLTQSLSSDNIPTDKELYITSGKSMV